RAAVGEGVQASWIAIAAGLGVIAVTELLAGPMTRALAGDSAVAASAAGGLRIAVVGAPAALLILAGNGWMRGVQQTRAPVIIVLAANGLSAVASPVLVYPAHLGLNGSAVANVAGQYLGAAWFLWSLRQATRTDTTVWWVP